jgi:hypothetical protein
VSAWPWYVAGPAIGAFVVLFAWLTGKALGVSSSYGTVCSTCAPKVGYFQKKPYNEMWRLWFFVGLPLGGLAGALLAGPWAVTTSMGMFDAQITSNVWVKLGVLFGGGALAGFGARWANG